MLARVAGHEDDLAAVARFAAVAFGEAEVAGVEIDHPRHVGHENADVAQGESVRHGFSSLYAFFAYFPVSCGVWPSCFAFWRSRRVSRPQVRFNSSFTLNFRRPSFSTSI